MNNPIRILLAEDDKNLGIVLRAYLIAKGYDTVWAENGQLAYDEFLKKNFDFCIIDVMMPVKDGFTLVKNIRQHDKSVSILFLTARSSEEDKLKGFMVGADDYITKPFSMDELLLRMQAILRRSDLLRSPKKAAKQYQIGNFVFNTNKQTLISETSKKKLTSKESALLTLLCEKKNEVLDRSEALQIIWGDNNYFNARSMDVYITKLRKYLKSDPNIELINIHGIGFKLATSENEPETQLNEI